MEVFVTTTFIVIIAFSLLNMIMSFAIYHTSKRPLYLRTGLFWLLLIANFVIQSQSQDGEFKIIMGYGFTVIPLNMLCYVSLFFCDSSYPRKTLISVAAISLLLTLVLKNLAVSFTVKAMPFATAAAIPLLYVNYVYIVKNRAKLTPLMMVHAFMLFLLALHSFNFALFRMKPEAQLWGWPVAYGLYQLLAILIPALVLDFNHREEQGRLKEIIEEKTKNLVDANRDLHKLIRQKEYLFRMVTHDISTPLNIMIYKLEMVASKTLSWDKFLTSMTELTNRVVRMVEQVRSFDNVELTIAQLKIEDVNLLKCIQEVEALFEDKLHAKKVRLSYDQNKLSECNLQVDNRTFTNSVLPNIISNAIKFSHPEGKITISTEFESQEHIKLTIRDQGIGIPNSMLKELFDFESQTSRTGTSGEKGTGFGLPILAKIVAAYGGDIRITSKEEEGTQQGFTQVEIRLRGKMRTTSTQAA